jgi:hypothetical protein
LLSVFFLILSGGSCFVTLVSILSFHFSRFPFLLLRFSRFPFLLLRFISLASLSYYCDFIPQNAQFDRTLPPPLFNQPN